MPISWIRRPEVQARAFEQYTMESFEEAVDTAQRVAKEAEVWMKENAPWTDRTGNARRELYARVTVERDRYLIVIRFGHGVDYGIFLELARAGRFGIINPTIDKYGPEFMSEIVEGPYPYRYSQ